MLAVGSHDALLIDGTTVSVRPIEPDDAAGLVRFHASLSPETIRMRFFAPHPLLGDAEVVRYCTVDHHDREALVVMADDEIVGVARYDRLPGTADAEVAFVVTDRRQGAGVGTLLLRAIADRARQEGIERLVAETLGENRRMIHVFMESGLAPQTSWEHEVLLLVMPLADSVERTK